MSHQLVASKGAYNIMTNVLVVSKDIDRGSLLAKAIADLGMMIFFVDSLSKAEAYAQRLNADLVILDGSLPESSLRTLATALRPAHPLALLAAPGQTETSFPGLTFLGQPLDADRLREAVRRKLRASLPPPIFSVMEYVQLACMSRRSVEVRCSNGNASGRIWIVDGEVWNAQVVDVEGRHQLNDEVAFRYWVTQDEVTVDVQPTVSELLERTVYAQWEHLLLESMQLKDEGQLDALWEWTPSEDEELTDEINIGPLVAAKEQRKTNRPTAPPASSQTYPERARALVNQAIRAIMIGDYPEAAKSFEGALILAPDDKLVELRLHKVRAFLKGNSQP